MNPRIQKLTARLSVSTYPLCIEKSRLMTESYRRTEGEDRIVRRAKAMAHVLDHISIFIEDDELIVGNPASRPMGLEFDFYAGLWPEDEIDGLKAAGYDIADADKAEILAMNDYWRDENPMSRMGKALDDRLWPFMQSGMILPPWKDKENASGGGYAESGMGLGPGFYLMLVDFERVLTRGLNDILAETEAELAELGRSDPYDAEKRTYLESVKIAHEAVIRFAGRFADLAGKMAKETEDPARKAELEKIAVTCRRVPACPATTFAEAIQAFWFIFLMVTPSPTASIGRFDQYMYFFYKKDMESGTTTDEEVLELLQCLRIKDMQINRTSGKLARQKNAGMAKWHNMTIGGVTPEGEDATNELTYLVLDAVEQCPLPHPTVTVRVHEKTPEKLMIRALEVVRLGTGMPAFVGDPSYIGYLVKEGLSMEDAREYAMAGCIDAAVAGKSRIASYGMFIVPKVLEITMHNGIEPQTGRRLGPQTGAFVDFAGFGEFFDAFKKQLNHFLGLHAERNNIELSVSRELFPDPFRSSLMYEGIATGKALLDRTFPFENGAVMNPVGLVNVVDSLTAMKKLIYDEKKYSAAELMAALQADWQGNGYAAMRKAFLAAPKYGNNEDTADELAKVVFRLWADNTKRFETCLGGTHKPTGVSISAQWPGGLLTGATPDGRQSGECLADGAVSAMRGMDTKGPTAVLNSAMKIDQVDFQAALLNMKFHPSSMETVEDLQKLSFLIRTYFMQKGKHIQFNVVNEKTLRNAQQEPEKHQDLLVRIAGYSAHFIQLGKPMQEEIIQRTTHDRLQ